MIEELWIRNLGVIADATLPLGAGLTVISGETGAGKTMVVTALGLLLGERADTGDIRAGADQAIVEGRWLIDANSAVAARVTEAGGALERPGGDAGSLGASTWAGQVELIMARQLSVEGRSRATVGGRSTPVSLLADIGEQLVVVHGQSDQLRLRSTTEQRDALDHYAGPAFAELLARYGSAFERWHALQQELVELTSERERRAAEADELRGLVAELERVAPRPGEDAEVDEAVDRLTNLEELRLAAAQAHEQLSSETDGVDAVGLVEGARRALERVAPFDPALASITEAVANASYLVAEAATQVSGYLAGLDASSAAELERLQQRKAELTALIRRHGSLDEAIAFLDTGSARLLQLGNDDARIAQLDAELAEARADLARLASRVTLQRRDAAGRLGAAVTAELGALAMPDARLEVRVTTAEEFTAHGCDQVQLLLQPHRGAESRPIQKGASGGELSRVMLALEVVIAATDPVPTFVFDEVDAGIGGAAATEIGRRLARLAQHAQVIAVTHLAQVAAFATNHLTVVKGTDGSVTRSSVRRLDGGERVAELARLLSGMPDSQSGRAHARELLELATASA
ncbi:MAG: DNA repair protein RecN [Microbacterium sp.]|nr:DNA repair protein RecN [Microbacterium sp.]